MKKPLLICGLLLLLQGCSSIEQPTAQRSLVEHDYVFPAQPVDSNLAKVLSSGRTGAVSSIQGQSMQLGETFFSASGLTCRKVVIEQLVERLYCQRAEDNWFAVNRVISTYADSQELNAK